MTHTDGGPCFREVPLAAGIHFVATPIGNARDVTLRALDILASADLIAAEDTRTARHLMSLHGIHVRGRPMIAYHDHNGAAVRPKLLAAVREGKSVAYASEAGMPLIADPGYQLARAAIAEGLSVTCAPGPSAPLAALTLSGLPSDRFLFAGFPPATAGARRKWLMGLADVEATLLLFEIAQADSAAGCRTRRSLRPGSPGSDLPRVDQAFRGGPARHPGGTGRGAGRARDEG